MVDHLDVVSEHLLGPADELAGVAAIDEDLRDQVEAAEQAQKHGTGRDPVLDTVRMDHNGQQIAFGVYRDVTLTDFDFLARVVSAPPPFSTVFADCESTIATVGVAFRPVA